MFFLSNEASSVFNGTITISVLLAVVALVSPSITAVINNKHLLKMKELEILGENMRADFSEMNQIFSDYLLNLSNVVAMSKASYTLTLEQEADYKTSFLKCLLIVDSITRAKLVDIDNCINIGEYLTAEEKVISITEILFDQLQNYRKIQSS